MAPAADTIGGWDSSTLQRVVREMIASYPPDHFTALTVDALTVVDTFTARGKVSYEARDTFNVIGASGQAGFLNSWVANGGVYYAPAYTLTEDGWVRLRGAIKSGSVGSAAFVLPPGFRPASTSRHAVVSNALFGIVDIDKTGNVIPQSPSSNTIVSLDGIQFKTA